MAESFFFYDLETTGINSSSDRILQFAGQRTDLDFQPLDKPVNFFIKLTPDVIPSPKAILLSGLLPTKINQNGMTEAEFCEIFNNQLAKAGTIFTGFNNIRFDDEFIRYLNFRNFYDAYGWHWQAQASRWDMIDVVRMTRALRPEGINWPLTLDNKPTNRLELLTKLNNLYHSNAHDALSDTLATIEVAKLIKTRQPKLFNYLLKLRRKTELIKMLKNNDTFIYTSSHYSSDILHTTVVYRLSLDETNGTALVVDLRADISDFLSLNVDQLTELWAFNPDIKKPLLPVKTMKLNRCPAVAPISVLDELTIDRLKLDMAAVSDNRKQLVSHQSEFSRKIKKVINNLDNKRNKLRQANTRQQTADQRLYDNFISKADTVKFKTARARAKLAKNFEVTFTDQRLNSLYSLYRARNYPNQLNSQEMNRWRRHIKQTLLNGSPSKYDEFQAEINALKKEYIHNQAKIRLLNDLQTYVQVTLSGYET